MQNFIIFHCAAFGTDVAILLKMCTSYQSHYFSQIFKISCYNDKIFVVINGYLYKMTPMVHLDGNSILFLFNWLYLTMCCHTLLFNVKHCFLLCQLKLKHFSIFFGKCLFMLLVVHLKTFNISSSSRESLGLIYLLLK